ncbi:MAG: hypothetical protein HY043_04780 [Verrucomicrobia bacterium]|nr:hypothetical protein [Verrucomicrobiota bacterium]
MRAFENPALKNFAASFASDLVFAQVFISRRGSGYELRHVADCGLEDAQLQILPLTDLRLLAQSTEAGAFRPLKSAPNLRRGWRVSIASDAELQSALDQLYPGAIADWHAAQSPVPPVTNFREFTNRQTGMYRIAQMLTDAQAAQVITAACHKNFCLKQRLWTVANLPADSRDEKSLLPCLEPCALLLEFARKAMRIEQEEQLTFPLAPAELNTLVAALEHIAEHASTEVREGDFNAAANARRAQLVLEKLRPLVKGGASVDLE